LHDYRVGGWIYSADHYHQGFFQQFLGNFYEAALDFACVCGELVGGGLSPEGVGAEASADLVDVDL
jgi:hypothetical protein